MAYTTIDDSEAYFQVKLWSGNSSTQALTFDGETDMEPTWVWGKQRGGTQHHQLCDQVRGANKMLFTSSDDNEESDSDILNSFDSNGFTVGYQDQLNDTGQTYVAWCWKGGGSGSSNSEGDITATVSADTTAGFSLMKFTGNGSTSQSVGHGLNGTPALWMIKNLTDDETDLTMYFEGTDRIKLTTAENMEQNYLMSANSTTITTPSDAGNTWGNTASKNYLIWAWQNVQGFSKFGNYTGTGNANGAFVYLGFKPAMVMIKGYNTENWHIYDNKRDLGNPTDKALQPNSNSQTEFTETGVLDFLSNGFKLGVSGSGHNGGSTEYLYWAFAEAPFVNSNGVPCNAR